MTRSPVRLLIAILAAGLTAVALTSVPAAGTGKAVSSPVVTTVTPLDVKVGQRLTIKGRGFIPGRKRNTVVFKRDGQRAIFVKADRATRTQLTVVVPDKLDRFLAEKDGKPQATRFRVRVLARRLAKRFTPLSKSPRIGPAPASAGGGAGGDKPAGPSTPAPDCDEDRTPDATDLDDDNDFVADTAEAAFGTARCGADTDGDGLGDHFEIQSAMDLNGSANFPPLKTPWPNPRFAADADKDFDQDGMLAREEHDLWVRSGKGPELTYSDGDQSTTTGADPAGDDHDAFNNLVPADGAHLDHDANGILTDDERDFDGDRLSNWDESHGRMRGDWWEKRFRDEKPFFGVANAPMTDAAAINAVPERAPMYADPDIDGDRIPDGADDQDHDGWSNEDELHRSEMEVADHTAPLIDLNGDGADDEVRVNPYNPCLPDRNSRTCTLHPPFVEAWAPFGDNPLPAFDVAAGGPADRTRPQQLIAWRMAPAPTP